MAFDIHYHKDALRDADKFSRPDLERIKSAIESKLTKNPEIFGKHLSRSLSGNMRLRVGDCRVIYRIEKSSVEILLIGHRSKIYRDFI